MEYLMEYFLAHPISMDGKDHMDEYTVIIINCRGRLLKALQYKT